MAHSGISSLSLYIHIPFCRSKCGYCDFNSFGGLEALVPGYVEALTKEIQFRARNSNRQVSTIYFGGGTPSLLSISQIDKIIGACNKYYNVDKAAEITLEANPGTVTCQWLTSLHVLGFNRLSLGFQSLDDTELKILGRIHSATQAVEAFTFARQAGFENINIDLIYNLPGQTLTHWKYVLNRAITIDPDHFSLYPLTLEETTPLGHAVESGSMPAPDPDVAAEMYEYAEECMAGAGYEHYELSNWSKPGKVCRHNLTYWENRPYLGLGAGAHSFINGYRKANTDYPGEYITILEAGNLPEQVNEYISVPLEISEIIILGLRLIRGVELGDIKSRFGIDISTLYKTEIEELIGCGLLEKDDSRLCLTRRGRLLGNEVFWRFLPKS